MCTYNLQNIPKVTRYNKFANEVKMERKCNYIFKKATKGNYKLHIKTVRFECCTLENILHIIKLLAVLKCLGKLQN